MENSKKILIADTRGVQHFISADEIILICDTKQTTDIALHGPRTLKTYHSLDQLYVAFHAATEIDMPLFRDIEGMEVAVNPFYVESVRTHPESHKKDFACISFREDALGFEVCVKGSAAEVAGKIAESDHTFVPTRPATAVRPSESLNPK